MQKHETEELSRWYVIHTRPKQENRAEYNLRAWNVETFAPHLKQRQHNQFTGEPFYTIKPLFTSYIFARFVLSGLYHKVRFTRGIHSLVSIGDSPVPVSDDVIELIRSRIDEEGFVRIGKDLKPGDRVVIEDGPLRGFTGIFEREMNDSERVVVLLNTVKYHARVLVQRQRLEYSNQ